MRIQKFRGNMQFQNEKLKVYYLGSDEVSVPVLKTLHASNEIELIGCGTQPDRPQGRKRVLQANPVGQWCEEAGVDVDKISNVNQHDFISRLSILAPHIILVFAFGQLLKKQLLELAPLGCLNIHTSLLPKYRGASPIQAAILNSDSKTGVSYMQMEEGLDSGPVFYQVELPLKQTEDYSSLSTQLADLAAKNTLEVLEGIASQKLQSQVQDASLVNHVGKIKKEDGKIRWDLDANQIACMVRAYVPWPGAWFMLSSKGKLKKITITKSSVIETVDKQDYQPGQTVSADKTGWVVACGRNNLLIERLIPEGKREMDSASFIRGSNLEVGTFLNETDHSKLREPSDKDLITG